MIYNNFDIHNLLPLVLWGMSIHRVSWIVVSYVKHFDPVLYLQDSNCSPSCSCMQRIAILKRSILIVFSLREQIITYHYIISERPLFLFIIIILCIFHVILVNRSIETRFFLWIIISKLRDNNNNIHIIYINYLYKL